MVYPLSRKVERSETSERSERTAFSDFSVLCVLAVLFVFSAIPLHAQILRGDSAWAAGDFHTARIAYERTLAENPESARANFRLGILLSWDGQLDSALVLIGRARAADPSEPAFAVEAAQVLAWAGRYDASLALYDSVLAQHPDNHDAAMGRAQTLAWDNRLAEADSAYGILIAADPDDLAARTAQAQVSAWRGQYDAAIARYQAVLDRDPDNVEARVGLAQTCLWDGRPVSARSQADLVLAQHPDNLAAQKIRKTALAALRPALDLALGWSLDSDENTSWWQIATVRGLLTEQLIGFVTAGLLEASDPTQSGIRTAITAGATWTLAATQVTAAMGLDFISPSDTGSYTIATGRISGSRRFSPAARVGVGLGWEPLEGTAFLMRERLALLSLDADGDFSLKRGISLGAGAGLASVSDGNRRLSAIVVAMKQLPKGFAAGVAGRLLGYRSAGVGYFSPDLYWFLEGRGSWTRQFQGRWEARVSGGLGVQQIDTGTSLQGEWHLEGRIARQFRLVDEIALSGGLTNSAASSTTGAYRFYTAALTARIGL